MGNIGRRPCSNFLGPVQRREMIPLPTEITIKAVGAEPLSGLGLQWRPATEERTVAKVTVKARGLHPLLKTTCVQP
ncbi:MAG: hypothetical protein ACI8TQ_000942 [Planctomycetota bacterium]|jgi:hypothetical protein